MANLDVLSTVLFKKQLSLYKIKKFVKKYHYLKFKKVNTCERVLGI